MVRLVGWTLWFAAALVAITVAVVAYTHPWTAASARVEAETGRHEYRVVYRTEGEQHRVVHFCPRDEGSCHGWAPGKRVILYYNPTTSRTSPPTGTRADSSSASWAW